MPEGLPQNPQQWRIVVDRHLMLRAVNNESDHKLRHTIYLSPKGSAANPGPSSISIPSAPGARFVETTSAHAKFAKAIFHDKNANDLGHQLYGRFSHPQRAIEGAVLNGFADVFGRDGVS